MNTQIILAVVLTLSVCLIGILAYALFAARKSLSKYSAITDIEREVEKQRASISKEKSDAESKLAELERAANEAERNRENSQSELSNLQKQIAKTGYDIEMQEHGIFTPMFDFDDTEQFKDAIKSCVERQKVAIKSGTAAWLNTNMTYNGSLSKGQAMVKRHCKLMMRAFNGESDSIISKVKWNNVSAAKERIEKAFDAINKLSQDAQLENTYLALKLEELDLNYGKARKHQEEKELARERAAELRDQERAEKEIQDAIRKGEDEEKRWEDALAKAKQEVGDAADAKIAELEAKLKEAHEKKEMAVSQARLTKRGFVYIISNIGSFGENVYKIGLTRRLNPDDRVRELGDASVPFRFDTHALIFSEDAPKLESDLHDYFDAKRVNGVNKQKEFFKVEIEDIQSAVKQMGVDAEFIVTPEAREYRQTLAERSGQ